MKEFLKLLIISILIFTPLWAEARKKDNKKTENVEKTVSPEEKLAKFYKELSEKGTKDEGLFTVWHKDDKYYFEIPDSILHREILGVTRYARTSMDLAFSGEAFDSRIYSWEKRNDKVIHFTAKSYRKVASEESDLYPAVRACMEPAIIMSFDVVGKTHDGVPVIDVTELFRKDCLVYELAPDVKKKFAINGIEDKSCYIDNIKSFPRNVEILTTKTYKVGNNSEMLENEGLGLCTAAFHTSLLLLPEKMMKPRLSDWRVGYFTNRHYDYSNNESQYAERVTYASHWDLQPKDMDAYMRGELVEPVKPIVLYLSPSIPKQWIPYVKAGVEDWQPAFEAAGFKNAILARPFPTVDENPDFDPLDARYSVVEYFPSYVENSYGPRIADPRSGEIINTHVCLFHNALKLLHDWYMLQCGAADPRARNKIFEEDLMGRLVRYLVCHEVGHTLGLLHNFGASSAYPTDSLRSASFTRVHGTTASIMDYARFNYVAQPEDKGVAMFPVVGEYDKFAIEWGYRLLPDAKTPEDEILILNNFIKEKQKDPSCRYIRQFFLQTDPRGQTEDLGDDPVKSAAYGLKNLKIAADSLDRWVAREGYDYSDLQDAYKKLIRQWTRFIGHVHYQVTGRYEDYKTFDQEGYVYSPIPTEKRKEAIRFLSDNMVVMPQWIINQPYIRNFDAFSLNTRNVMAEQGRTVKHLLSIGALIRLEEEFAADPAGSYNPTEYYTDVRKAIWRDLYGDTPSDFMLRTVERTYLTALENDLKAKSKENYVVLDMKDFEFKTRIRQDLKALLKDLKSANPSDPEVRQHYRECIDRINLALDPEFPTK